MARPDLRRAGPALGLVAVAALALGPVLLHRGVVLIGDMTFVPEQPWKSAWLGLDGSVPRAVPADAFVSVLSQAIAGDLLQKLILLGTLLGAGLGLLRLTELLGASRLAGFAAAVLFVWNPYVHERLGIGHWGLLLGYAALPWVVVAAYDVRRGRPAAWARLALPLAVAAVGSPTGGLIAAVAAVVVGVDLGRRTTMLATLGPAAVVNLPWLVPGALASGLGSDPGGVRAFAAHADSPFGVLGSLATFGGIWKESVVAPERDDWLLATLALAASVASLAVLVGRVRRGSATEPGPLGRLMALGAGGFLLALLPSTRVGAELVRTLVEDVPGGGLLRDSQKWVLPFVLVTCLGFALVVDKVMGLARANGLGPRTVGVALAVGPLVLLPSLGWGLAGKLEPVRVPGEWAKVATVLEEQPAGQRRTVVLPFSTYQRFDWNDQQAVLDPAIRFFPGQVVTSDRLVLSGSETVAGDSTAAAKIAAALAAKRPLTPVLEDAGVRYLLWERTAGGAGEVELPAGTVLHDGPELRLLDLGTSARLDRADHPTVIVTADLLAALLVVVSVIFLAVRRISRKPDVIG